jgi:hypothetical protein
MMRRILFAATAGLALLATSSLAVAETVDTRIGKIELEAGYPSKASVEKLFDEMDFQRATQAYIWALPIVAFNEWKLAHEKVF